MNVLFVFKLHISDCKTAQMLMHAGTYAQLTRLGNKISYVFEVAICYVRARTFALLHKHTFLKPSVHMFIVLLQYIKLGVQSVPEWGPALPEDRANTKYDKKDIESMPADMKRNGAVGYDNTQL